MAKIVYVLEYIDITKDESYTVSMDAETQGGTHQHALEATEKNAQQRMYDYISTSPDFEFYGWTAHADSKDGAVIKESTTLTVQVEAKKRAKL